MCLQIFCCIKQHAEQQNKHSCCQYFLRHAPRKRSLQLLPWDNGRRWPCCYKKDFLRAWVKNVPMLSVVSSEAQFPLAFHISAGLPSGLSHRHSLRGILPDHWGFVWKQFSLGKKKNRLHCIFFLLQHSLYFCLQNIGLATHIPAMVSCFFSGFS